MFTLFSHSSKTKATAAIILSLPLTFGLKFRFGDFKHIFHIIRFVFCVRASCGPDRHTLTSLDDCCRHISQPPAQTVSALLLSNILAAVLSLLHRVDLVTGDTPTLNK